MVADVATTRLKYRLRPIRAASSELEVVVVVVRALADDRSNGLSRIDKLSSESAEASLIHVVLVPRTNFVLHTSILGLQSSIMLRTRLGHRFRFVL